MTNNNYQLVKITFFLCIVAKVLLTFDVREQYDIIIMRLYRRVKNVKFVILSNVFRNIIRREMNNYYFIPYLKYVIKFKGKIEFRNLLRYV